MEIVKIAVVVLGGTGLLFAAVLAVLSKKLSVSEDPRVGEVLAALPGLNCGACGFSGCRPYAEAVVKGCNLFQGCLPGGEDVNSKIAEILGISGCTTKKSQVVVCRCGAETAEKKASVDYSGPATCRAAHLIGGIIDCKYGCLFLDDCIRVCPVAALALKSQRIIVDHEKCIGCGQCLKACPRNLFVLVPFKPKAPIYYVACSNKETVLNVKKVCSRGCIGCGICARVENSPYYLKDNLSCVDPAKAEHRGSLEEGKAKCPTKCIFVGAGHIRSDVEPAAW